MSMTLPDLTVIILTYNEEKHIARAIKSITPLRPTIYVVDSGSTDRTIEIAKSYGAEILINKFVNYAQQFNWAIDHAVISTEWVMRLDADEIVELDLCEEIKLKIPSLPSDIVGLNLNRKHIFMDRWIRHGGRYPLRLLRIWRNGHGKIEDRWMDEHMVVWGGSTISLRGGFCDHNLNDLTFFTDKHNKYATREAIDVINQRHNLFISNDGPLQPKSTSFQASFKRLVKERIYNKLPFTLGAIIYFLWRYILQLGFMDGRPGLIYHLLQGWWYRFLVGAKVMELEQAIAHLHDKADICTELSKLTGHKLEPK